MIKKAKNTPQEKKPPNRPEINVLQYLPKKQNICSLSLKKMVQFNVNVSLMYFSSVFYPEISRCSPLIFELKQPGISAASSIVLHAWCFWTNSRDNQKAENLVNLHIPPLLAIKKLIHYKLVQTLLFTTQSLCLHISMRGQVFCLTCVICVYRG